MTVNSKKRGRPERSRSQLTADSIIDCAKELMKKEGKVPSIRRLAGDLGVDAMAIYHYFSSKSVLLEAVAVSLMESIYEPTGNGDWQGELSLLCQSYLSLLKDHAGLLETMLSMSEDGPAQVFIPRFYTALAPLNLDPGVLKDALDLLADYLHGFAFTMSCNKDSNQLTVEQVDGPLNLICRALAAEGAVKISTS